MSSTIAFNSAAQQSSTFVAAGGLQIYGTSADLGSLIIANNTAGATSFDVGTSGGGITGANNLIRTSSDLMPADTITHDPQLLPLQDNGGETATLALAANSPAIDQGNNQASAACGQRGLGSARVFGAAPDIGAL